MKLYASTKNLSNALQHTFHRKGLNSKGFSKQLGSKCGADKTGRTFHPAGITIPAKISIV
jgi:hypothetical protein